MAAAAKNANSVRTSALPVQVSTGGLIRADGSTGAQKTAPNGEPYDHRFIASGERLASDGGVILTSAWRLDEYMKRPRWIAMHDIMGHSAPITQVSLGRCVDARIEGGLPVELVGQSGKGLVQYMRYASTPFAQEVRTLYDEGGLDDVSVRWDPRTEEARAPYDEELRLYGRGLAWVATRADLLETSAVLLGADPGAKHIRVDDRAIEAFERARSAGVKLPEMEKFIRGIERERKIVIAVRAALAAQEGATETVVPTDAAAVTDTVTVEATRSAASTPETTEAGGDPAEITTIPQAEPVDSTAKTVRGLDASAVQDAMAQMAAGFEALDAILSALGPVRQTLQDAQELMANLVTASFDAALEPGTDEGAAQQKAADQQTAGTEGQQDAGLAAAAQAKAEADKQQTADIAKAASGNAPAKPEEEVAGEEESASEDQGENPDEEQGKKKKKQEQPRGSADAVKDLEQFRAEMAALQEQITALRAAIAARNGVAGQGDAAPSPAPDKPERADDVAASAGDEGKTQDQTGGARPAIRVLWQALRPRA